MIALRGFRAAADAEEVIRWMARGSELADFIAGDVEGELYGQDPGAQVYAIDCTDAPEVLTHAYTTGVSKQAIVHGFTICLPLKVLVKSGDGTDWVLIVNHQYEGRDWDQPERRKLVLNFSISAAENPV